MPTEHETKVLEIDVKEIEGKLKKLGAKKKSDTLMKRWVFDLEAGKKWIRLRDNGNNITLAYKHKKGSGISETEEIEVVVDDFDKTFEILSKMNFNEKYYRESRRKIYVLKGMEFCIDEWPKIPPMLEIEAGSEKKVKEGLKMLGLEGKDAGNLCMIDVGKIYNIDFDKTKKLRF